MESHEYYMKRTLELAKKGWGRTNPNPLVGAVIVKNGEIIAEGWHDVLGGDHAEVAAFKNAKESVKGSTMYVNLEPCSHFGRTPPCARAIIDRGVSNVVISMCDPNPKVSGNGIRMLKEAGICVYTGVLESEAARLNEIFIKYITKKKPFVIMKTAMTLDGKTASFSGDSKWITGEDSREFVHVLRDRVSSIMVGINTVLADDPSLTTRLPFKECKDPVRIIADSKGRIPLNCKVINSSSPAGVILATAKELDKDREEKLKDKNVRIISTSDASGRVDLSKLMGELYLMEIDSVLIEGGGTLNASALEAGIVDKVFTFIAPKIIGGCNALTPVEGAGRKLMSEAYKLRDVSVTKFKDDILVEGYI
ncbi:MAG TPA: bifunctional diaminohydroxyphosphoribosylaminopyrimidine deaminase/5-amino-6-(5-phosphoribosylamino)uracil reductase RibD [Clostridia bacterium]